MCSRVRVVEKYAVSSQHSAVLLVDVINSFDFPNAAPLVEAAENVAAKLASFCERARAAKVPIIYVNDNFGRWRSDFRTTLEYCTRSDSAGQRVSHLLRPHDEDYFVLKPMHSGFYASTLEVLLAHLKIETLVLAGFATDLCVLFTAHDAYMRKFELYVPRDLTAANTLDLAERALNHLQHALNATTDPSDGLEFS